MARLLPAALTALVALSSRAGAADASQRVAFGTLYDGGGLSGASRRRARSIAALSVVGGRRGPPPLPPRNSALALRLLSRETGCRRHRGIIGGISQSESAAALHMARWGAPPAAAMAAAPARTNSGGGGGVSFLSRRIGDVFALLSKLVMKPERIKIIWRAVSDAVHIKDALPLILLGWGTVPLARAANSLFFSSATKDAAAEGEEEAEKLLAEDQYASPDEAAGGRDDEESSDGGGAGEEEDDTFVGTYLYEAASHVSQAARIGSAVYAVRIVLVALSAGGLQWASARRSSWIPRGSARVMYTVWAALRVRYFKRRLLAYTVEQDPKELGRARVYDRASDYLIYGVAAFFLFDALHLEVGMGLRSVLGLGGVGSVVFGLASKELAQQVVSGFALSASQKFYDGDKIKLGDGTTGKVLKIGAMETEIRASDETITRIPNSQIVNQRVSNLSRQEYTQVTQTLRFSYDDIKKLPVLMKEIKFQIQRSCPRLVTNGTRPFRAHWRDFKEDHVECVVQCHFRLKPGEEYWDNRMLMLEAIARSADKHGVKFAMPLNYNKNEDVTPPNRPRPGLSNQPSTADSLDRYMSDE